MLYDPWELCGCAYNVDATQHSVTPSWQDDLLVQQQSDAETAADTSWVHQPFDRSVFCSDGYHVYPPHQCTCKRASVDTDHTYQVVLDYTFTRARSAMLQNWLDLTFKWLENKWFWQEIIHDQYFHLSLLLFSGGTVYSGWWNQQRKGFFM